MIRRLKEANDPEASNVARLEAAAETTRKALKLGGRRGGPHFAT